MAKIKEIAGFKVLKVITSHVGVTRFYMETEGNAGYVDRVPEIPSPYAFSARWLVKRWQGKKVVIREVGHRRHLVLEVPANVTIHKEDLD